MIENHLSKLEQITDTAFARALAIIEKSKNLLQESDLHEGGSETKEHLEYLQSLIVALREQYELSKATQKSLKPIMRMGGFRSTMICLVDSLDLMSRSLEQNATQSFSR